eukprot:Skav204792  [mRNA]  locus=scaffold763:389372:394284:+ [translate_table: standard]
MFPSALDWNKVGHHGASALFIAALSAQAEMVSVWAADTGRNGFLEIVQSLCEARANIEQVDEDGTSTVEIAQRSGAGLSAADAILHALGLSADGINVRVTHVFGQSSLASMYRDEEWLAQLMKGSVSDPRYTAESQLQEILEDGTCIIQTKEGQETVQEARDPEMDGQPSSHPYFLEVKPETLQLADSRTGQASGQAMDDFQRKWQCFVKISEDQ